MTTTIKTLNKKLERVNLELVRDKYTKKVNCFCTTLKQDKDQLEAMNIIRRELLSSQKLSDLTWMSYFK